MAFKRVEIPRDKALAAIARMRRQDRFSGIGRYLAQLEQSISASHIGVVEGVGICLALMSSLQGLSRSQQSTVQRMFRDIVAEIASVSGKPEFAEAARDFLRQFDNAVDRRRMSKGPNKKAV
jgi:hypothetical protein